jgi:SAM-dependent methyltransferase
MHLRAAAAVVGDTLAERATLLVSTVPAILPVLDPPYRRVLDLGCGSSRTLGELSLGAEAVRIGVDVGITSLRAAPPLSGVRYTVGDAHALPFASGAFDLVISKVALPYTDIPRALREVYRVLCPGGRLWLTLHPLRMAVMGLWSEIAAGRLRNVGYRAYVIVNGLLLDSLGREFRFPLSGRIESYQSVGGIARVLVRVGFTNVQFEQRRRGAGHEADDHRYGPVFAMAARKAAGP